MDANMTVMLVCCSLVMLLQTKALVIPFLLATEMMEVKMQNLGSHELMLRVGNRAIRHQVTTTSPAHPQTNQMRK
jgi:hypothetical protein